MLVEALLQAPAHGDCNKRAERKEGRERYPCFRFAKYYGFRAEKKQGNERCRQKSTDTCSESHRIGKYANKLDISEAESASIFVNQKENQKHKNRAYDMNKNIIEISFYIKGKQQNKKRQKQ